MAEGPPPAAAEAGRSPAQVVAALDRDIVGQDAAKRAVAIALRNRWRRRRVPPPLDTEIQPNNILMVGPTGVGKTEIARRLAGLVGAPFVKVEATKYTEVGYVGRDVESIIRDLIDLAVATVREERRRQSAPGAEERALRRLEEAAAEQEVALPRGHRALLLGRERAGLPEGRLAVALAWPAEVADSGGDPLREAVESLRPARVQRVELPLAEAFDALVRQEIETSIDGAGVVAEARARVQQKGIVFIDEIDKICGDGLQDGTEVSRGGVQRDILPIVEGCTVATRYGPVVTRHILFIAAGAFHSARVADLIPELQGRFPIRVELDPLGVDELARVLVEPRHSIVRQYQALLATEGVRLAFDAEAIDEIARVAARANESTENIGARRLFTIMGRLLDQVLFESVAGAPRKRVRITAAQARRKLGDLVEDEDLSRYIL